MIEVTTLAPFGIALGICVLSWRLNAIQKHPFWSYSTVSSLLFSLMLLSGSLCFLMGTEELTPLYILVPVFGAAAAHFQSIATRKFSEMIHSPLEKMKTLLRKDIVVVGESAVLTTEFIRRITTWVGVENIAAVLTKHARSNPLFRGCKVKDSTLDTPTMIKNIQNIDGKRGTGVVFTSFLKLHDDLFGLCETMMSGEDITELFEDSLAAVYSQHGEGVYVYGLPLLLHRRVFEPLLASCTPECLEEVNARIRGLEKEEPLMRTLEVKNGKIELEEFYRGLARLNPDEMMERIIFVFSQLGNVFSSVKNKALTRKSERLLSKTVSHLTEKHPALTKYGVVKLMSKGVELSGFCRVLGVGESYLIKRPEKHDLEVLEYVIKHDLPALHITTSRPPNLQRENISKNVKTLWLSKLDVKGAVSPSALDILRDTVDNFITQNRGATVVLDGLEYLMLENGHEITVKFLYDLVSMAGVKRARLIVPIDPKAFTPSQLAQLERFLIPIS